MGIGQRDSRCTVGRAASNPVRDGRVERCQCWCGLGSTDCNSVSDGSPVDDEMGTSQVDERHERYEMPVEFTKKLLRSDSIITLRLDIFNRDVG